MVQRCLAIQTKPAAALVPMVQPPMKPVAINGTASNGLVAPVAAIVSTSLC
jgi:hypothetical protein